MAVSVLDANETFALMNISSDPLLNRYPDYYVSPGQVFLLFQYALYLIPLFLIVVRLALARLWPSSAKRYSELKPVPAETLTVEREAEFLEGEEKSRSGSSLSLENCETPGSEMTVNDQSGSSWSTLILPASSDVADGAKRSASPPLLIHSASDRLQCRQYFEWGCFSALHDARATSVQLLNRLSFHIVIMGLIYICIYLADVAQVFGKVDRIYSRDLFIALCAFILGSSLLSLKKSPASGGDKALNRDQTEEWKGWMQVIFLLYHYFAAKEVYNLIRVFIAAYVWLTGFGNFSYFYLRKDYSLQRLLKMLFRLNFAVVLIMLVTNNAYMLYYICPMHTYWFLTVYAMMAVKPHWNYSGRHMAIKFAAYAACNFMLFEAGLGYYVFQVLGAHSPLPLLSLDHSLHEWMFRASLDRWMCFAGMLSAMAYPKFEGWLLAVDQPEATKLSKRLKIVAAAVALAVVTLWLHYILVPLDKLSYNRLHPYTAALPITAYIFLRNYNQKLRSVHLSFFAWIGKRTLETYLLQFHIWLVDNAKSILSVPFLSPDYRLCNFVVATLVYATASNFMFQGTSSISNAFFQIFTKSSQSSSRPSMWWKILLLNSVVLLLLSFFISHVWTRYLNSR